jgi:hypothetical protein
VSSSGWAEIRLIGSLSAVEGAVRILGDSGAEIATNTGTQAVQKGKDGKVRRYLVARLAPAVQDATDAAAEGIDPKSAGSAGLSRTSPEVPDA